MPPRAFPQHARFHRLCPWLILALALVLHLWRLGQKSIWLDEAVSWDMATKSVPVLVAATAADIHPPLYYLLLKAWIWLFGDSPIGLRSLSAVSSLVALGLTYRLARRLLPFGIACAALWWCATSPHTLFYGQEARMYPSATAAVLGACLAYRSWVDSGFTRRAALVGYVACVTGALYLHYFTCFMIVAIWAHFLLLASGRYAGSGVPRVPWKPWLLANGAAAALFAPWAATAITQVTQGQGWREPVTLGGIPVQASNLARMLMFGTDRVPHLGTLSSLLVLSVLGAGLALTIGRAVLSRVEERGAFLALVALVPLAFGLALLPITGHLNLPRYLVYALPLVVIAAAYGLGSLRVRPAIVAGLLVLGSVTTFPSLAAYYDNPVHDYDARPLVTYLSHTARHGLGTAQDPIFVAPGYVTLVLRYLSRGDLDYQRIDTGADLHEAMAAGAGADRPVWLVVDYTWPGFDELAHDARVAEQSVPFSASAQIKLFRVEGSAPR